MLVGAGALLLVATVAIVVATYINDWEAAGYRRRSLLIYLTGVLASAGATAWLFAAAGLPLVCRIAPSPSCHWAGALVGMPLAVLAGVCMFLHVWKNPQQAQR